jgi:RNA polymerase sigma factor (sigma-70 family)
MLAPSIPLDSAAFAAELPWALSVGRQAGRILPPSVDAGDLDQAAREALAECLTSFDPQFQRGDYAQPVPFRAYARRRIYFACLMRFRGRPYREDLHDPLEDHEHKAIWDWTPEHDARQAQMQRLVAHALGFVDDPANQVLQLHYFAGFAIVDVAAWMGYSESHVSRLHTAGLSDLRDALARLGVRTLSQVM